MKKLVLLIFVGILPLFGFTQNNLVRWVSSNFSPTIDNNQITASNISVNGPVGLTAEAWGSENIFFSTSGWGSQSSLNTNRYTQFRITAANGFQVTPTNFNFKGRNQSGTSKIEVRYSKLANFSTYGTFTVNSSNTSTNYINYNLSFPANYISADGGSIYVRVYIYETNNNFHFNYKPGTFDGPTFTGTVSSTSILAVNDVVNVTKNTTANINVLNNDYPGNGTFTTVSNLSTPTNNAGTVSVNIDNTIQFTPANNYTGTSTFNYTVSNNVGGSSQAQVQVTVNEPALAEWGLTSNNTVTTQQPYVTANAVQLTGIAASYSNAGMALANFSDGSFVHHRYFDMKVKPTSGNNINITNLVFEQERLVSGSLSGPSDYQIKYKVITGGFSETEYDFFQTATVLVAGESIANNPIKNISLNLNLNSNQTLVVRFYAKGASDYNFSGWRIKANTLKFRGNQVCVLQGNPATYSNNFWTGYAYTWTETPAATNYIGYVKENETFNRDLGTNTINGGIDGTNYLCSTPTDNFFIRYRMRKTFPAGSYTFTVGADDGYRMSIDGGATWLINDFTDHGYATKTASACFDGVTPTLLVLEYYENGGNSQVSFSYASTIIATAPTAINASSTSICSGSPFTLTATGGTGSIFQWGTGTVGSNIIEGQSSNAITLTQLQETTYWVRRVNDACNTGYTAAVTITLSIQGAPGEPTLFGDNTWNVYGYDGQSMTPTIANYRGYYTQNTLGCDTQDTANNGWDTLTSPSASAGWNGCQVPNDNFTLVHKRKGFPVGSYQLIVKNYDDATKIFINGEEVRNYASWFGGDLNYQDDLGFFCLNANSTIEVVTVENGGSATFKLNILAANAIYSGTEWSGNVNPSNKSVEIHNNMSLANDLTICSCIIKAGTIITIPADKTLTVLDDIIVEEGGQIIIENNGALVQINDDATYTGAINSFVMKRNTQPVFRLDYTYWSSPVKQNSGFTLSNLSPQTMFNKFMKWNQAGTPQAWQIIQNGSEVMVPGRGYLVRAPQNFNLEGAGAPQIFDGAFIGIPNNGVITHAVSGSTTASRWNLIGNPYPSAIDAETFLNENSGVLGGTLYFWTHNTALSNASGYGYSASDYASWNLSGGTATTSQGADENSNLSEPTGKIAAGQSFFVQGVSQGNATVVFNNSMRVTQGNLNNQFFKPSPSQPVENWQMKGKHRVWLNLTSTQNHFNQILVGYIENATNGLDTSFDGAVFSGTAVSLYSIVDSKNLTIQGRALPFSNEDEVPLGYKTTLTGTLTISIDHFDGLMTGQNIYLKDNVLNIVHNLKDSDYEFTTVPGTFNDRFVLRYLPEETLGTNLPTIDANTMLVFNNNNQINIKSTEQVISSVAIYDLQGRLIFTKNNINAQEFATQSLSVSNQMIVVKVITDNKAELVKKVMLK